MSHYIRTVCFDIAIKLDVMTEKKNREVQGEGVGDE